MLPIIDVVIVLDKCNEPFRGHNWDKTTHRDDGNFDFFLHWRAELDPVLKGHLQTSKKNASYTSPQVQNELIELEAQLHRNGLDAWAAEQNRNWDG